jgi:hypothetical protein
MIENVLLRTVYEAPHERSHATHVPFVIGACDSLPFRCQRHFGAREIGERTTGVDAGVLFDLGVRERARQTD